MEWKIGALLMGVLFLALKPNVTSKNDNSETLRQIEMISSIDAQIDSVVYELALAEKRIKLKEDEVKNITKQIEQELQVVQSSEVIKKRKGFIGRLISREDSIIVDTIQIQDTIHRDSIPIDSIKLQ